MEGRRIIRLKSGGPPLHVNTENRDNRSTAGAFVSKRRITYTFGCRKLSLSIILKGHSDRVNDAVLDVEEENGKGSSAILELRVVGDDTYGILSQTSSDFLGSYSSSKEQFCVPPLATTDVVTYVCPLTGSAGFFSLEKKANRDGVVASVKATHAFVLGDEAMHVKVKITYDRRVGLKVEVDEPVKLTTEYICHSSANMVGKLQSEMEARSLAFYNRLSAPKAKPNGNKPNVSNDGGRFRRIQ